MSESAEEQLRIVASLRTGAVVASFPKGSDGSYGDHFRSAVCPNPRASPEEREEFLAATEAGIDRDVLLLKPYADADRSEFVSTAEARSFCEQWLFGCKSEVVRAKEGNDPARIGPMLRMAPAAYVAAATTHADFLERIHDLPGLHSCPEPIDTAR